MLSAAQGCLTCLVELFLFAWFITGNNYELTLLN